MYITVSLLSTACRLPSSSSSWDKHSLHRWSSNTILEVESSSKQSSMIEMRRLEKTSKNPPFPKPLILLICFKHQNGIVVFVHPISSDSGFVRQSLVLTLFLFKYSDLKPWGKLIFSTWVNWLSSKSSSVKFGGNFIPDTVFTKLENKFGCLTFGKIKLKYFFSDDPLRW